MQPEKSILTWVVFYLLFVSSSLIADNAKVATVTKTIVKSSKTDTQICANISVYDYSDNDNSKSKLYVKVFPDHISSVSWNNWDELCINGLHPNIKYKINLYKNMPIGSMKLDRDYTFEATTLDYKPSVDFPEEGYILPTKGDITIPVDTINVNQLSVYLYRINSRNLINSVNQYGLSLNIPSYRLGAIESTDGYLLWEKKLKINQYIANTPKTTAIPVGDFLENRKPGVYILYAKILDDEGKEADDEYFYDNDAKTQWFMVSDIGVYSLKSDKGLEILTKKLSSAEQYNNVKLQLVASNNEILDLNTTKNGHAFFPASVLQGTDGLKAKAIYAYGEDDDFSVLDLSKPAHDLTDRGVEGRESPGIYDAFVYSNRDIFRPGESMTFHTLVRDHLAFAQAGLNVSVKIFDSREVEIYTKTLKTDDLGHFSDSVAISESSSTGKWRISVFAGSQKEIGKYTFLVEDFVPPKIKVDVQNHISHLKPKQNEIIKIAAKYLNEEALPDANVEVTTILHKAKNPFNLYHSYNFGDTKEEFGNQYLTPLNLVTDENGELDIPFNIDQSFSTSFPLSAHIDIAVSELGGRPVHKILNQHFMNKSAYIGLKQNFLNHSVNMDSSPTFDLIYLKNTNLAQQELNYQLIKETTHWHWHSKGNSWEYYKTYSDDQIMDNGIVTTSAVEPVSLKLKKLDWGSYRLEIKDGSDAITSYRFSSGYEQSSSKSSPDRLPVSIDKQTYKVGDKLRINITPKFNGPIVVYIAHHNIVESKTINAVSGENAELSFEVSEKWGSSAYVLATAFRAQSKNLGANRAIGIVPIQIMHPEQEIKLSIEHTKKTEANKKLKVTISAKETGNLKTNFTLAAVDQGVLNLTAYKVPDPIEYFLGQQKLGIEIRDIYAQLIQARGAHAKFNVGSDGELAEAIRDGVVSNKREVVALFTKVLSFDDKGVAEVELEIPDYQGALKLVALAWNKNATGSAQSELTVKDSISMEYYMPSFISVGDRVETLLTVNFDNTIQEGKYTIKLSPKGGVALDKERYEVNINKNASAKFMKKINMNAKTYHDGDIDIEVSKDGKTVASKHWEIGVRTPYPQTYVRKKGILKENEIFDASKIADESLWSSIHTLSLKISGKPLLPVTSLTDEIINYPWHCAEQTTSRAMPWLFTKRDSSKDLLIQKAIDRLVTYQHIDGGFGLWEGSRVDMWLSAYVLDFLTRAKKAGYDVPKNNITQGLNWIENHLNRWSDNAKTQEADAYGLYVLTRSGRILMSEIKYHATDKNSKIQSAQAWGHLGGALAYIGEKELAKEIFSKAKSSLGNAYDGYYANYGGGFRDQASLIILMNESEIGDDWQELFADLALKVKKRTYLSTQEIGALLRASFLVDNTTGVDLKLSVNNQPLPLEHSQFSTKAKDLKSLPLITNKSTSNAWYDLAFKATPVPSSYDAKNNNGFSILKTIYDMNGQKIDMSNIQQNSRLVVVIEGNIENKGIENPLITDWVASGFELENPHITGIDATSALNWLGKQSEVEHAQYRNDRFAAALSESKDGNTSFKIAYIARAVSNGNFTLPPAKIEDMYQPRYRAFSQFLQGNIEIRNIRAETTDKISSNQNVTNNNKIGDSSTATADDLSQQDYLDVFAMPIKRLSRYKIEQLHFLRNAIFGHAGLSFEKSNPALHQKFLLYAWYVPSTDNSSEIYQKLSPLHKQNVHALLDEEKRRAGGLVLSDYDRVYKEMLNEKMLAKYDKESLRILRNSLFSRYGLSFAKTALQLDAIYAYMPWYKPKDITVSEIFDTQMTQLEKSNILLMIKLEKAL